MDEDPHRPDQKINFLYHTKYVSRPLKPSKEIYYEGLSINNISCEEGRGGGSAKS